MRYLPLIAMMLTAALASAAAAANFKPKTVGWVEFVRIKDVDMHMKAKLDTGATTSSIDADIIDIKQVAKRRKGFTGQTVVFSMTDDNGEKKKVFERKVARYVRIKKKGDSEAYIRRPVVEMTFCIAGREVREEVNLANRENFLYPVLVGRNMMHHAALLIDASRTFLTNPTCR